MQESGAYLMYKLSYSQFCFENRKFSLPWQQGISEPNVTGIFELADPENHTIESKITTVSYIQPKLWQFKHFPIETMLNFFRIFTKIQLNMKFHFCNPQKALPCAEPRRLMY